jgi:hypothetical protein
MMRQVSGLVNLINLIAAVAGRYEFECVLANCSISDRKDGGACMLFRKMAAGQGHGP